MQPLLGHAHVDTTARYLHLAPVHVKAGFDAPATAYAVSPDPHAAHLEDLERTGRCGSRAYRSAARVFLASGPPAGGRHRAACGTAVSRLLDPLTDHVPDAAWFSACRGGSAAQKGNSLSGPGVARRTVRDPLAPLHLLRTGWPSQFLMQRPWRPSRTEVRETRKPSFRVGEALFASWG